MQYLFFFASIIYYFFSSLNQVRVHHNEKNHYADYYKAEDNGITSPQHPLVGTLRVQLRALIVAMLHSLLAPDALDNANNSKRKGKQTCDDHALYQPVAWSLVLSQVHYRDCWRNVVLYAFQFVNILKFFPVRQALTPYKRCACKRQFAKFVESVGAFFLVFY